jgi:hypothetical protein
MMSPTRTSRLRKRKERSMNQNAFRGRNFLRRLVWADKGGSPVSLRRLPRRGALSMDDMMSAVERRKYIRRRVSEVSDSARDILSVERVGKDIAGGRGGGLVTDIIE